jgi:UDP-glucuronate decarboxylase
MEWILVTGGAGNIASHLTQRLLDTHLFKVVIIDNLVTGSIKKIPVSDHCVFVKADVNNYNEIIPIFLKYDFKYVFHFAALVGVKRTLENPLGVFNDINGIKNILDLSKSCGIKRVFYSSSSEVYGEPVSIPLRSIQNFHTPL